MPSSVVPTIWSLPTSSVLDTVTHSGTVLTPGTPA
jgi:hypothetical protein